MGGSDRAIGLPERFHELARNAIKHKDAIKNAHDDVYKAYKMSNKSNDIANKFRNKIQKIMDEYGSVMEIGIPIAFFALIVILAINILGSPNFLGGVLLFGILFALAPGAAGLFLLWVLVPNLWRIIFRGEWRI